MLGRSLVCLDWWLCSSVCSEIVVRFLLDKNGMGDDHCIVGVQWGNGNLMSAMQYAVDLQ